MRRGRGEGTSVTESSSCSVSQPRGTIVVTADAAVAPCTSERSEAEWSGAVSTNLDSIQAAADIIPLPMGPDVLRCSTKAC